MNKIISLYKIGIISYYGFMLATIISKIGLPLLVEAVSAGLNSIDHPDTKTASQQLKRIQSEMAQGRLSKEQLAQAQQAITNAKELESQSAQAAYREINKSLRAEIASNDPYVRRMRPTFVYIMAITWGAQMLAVAYAIIDDPAQAGVIMNGMASLSAIWTVGLSVLGIYVYKRSQEKTVSSHKTSFLKDFT